MIIVRSEFYDARQLVVASDRVIVIFFSSSPVVVLFPVSPSATDKMLLARR